MQPYSAATFISCLYNIYEPVKIKSIFTGSFYAEFSVIIHANEVLYYFISTRFIMDKSRASS